MKKVAIAVLLLINSIASVSDAFDIGQFNPPQTAPYEINNGFNEGLHQAQQYQMTEARIMRERQELEYEQQQAAQEQQAEQEQQNAANSPFKIIIFSQERHPVYLGCVNCPANFPDSIHNNGIYGSVRSGTSIYNYHSSYGSHTSNYSSCNPHALYPPYIFDSNGHVYGVLTLNARLHNAIRAPRILTWLKTSVCIK